MIARVLTLLRFRVPRRPVRETRPAAPPRRKSARLALAFGLAAVVAATAGLSAALETAKPEWRDPEFGHRLGQVRKWRAGRPGRPLVVVVGSSRTQMGLCPAAMGFPDRSGSPVVYNFGYRGAHPLGAWLQLMRVLDAGVKPDAVLVHLATVEVAVSGPAERQFPHWVPRYSLGDLRRLAPYTADPRSLRRKWVETRLTPWTAYGGPILAHLLPGWLPPLQRVNCTWATTDECGFTPYWSPSVPDEVRTAALADVRRLHDPVLKKFRVGETAESVFRDLVARCRTEGIPVAFSWLPESPTYTSWYLPATRASVADYQRRLASELGVVVFPAPGHLAEEDFVDGYHLLRGGAEKYSRWLADTQLRPWLAREGVMR